MGFLNQHRPSDVAALEALVRDAAASGEKLALQGGGSKAAFGASNAATVVDLRGFAGVIEYDPAEMVLTCGAGTPFAEIEALLASNNQMLAFEPFDNGPLFGQAAGASTIGGVVAAGVSGSRRLSRGAARDHLLGFKAVSGRGESFVGGAKVVKNVTGYDLPKLATASWGRLFAMTEVTLKALPKPEEALTLAVEGLDPAAAVALMAKALGSQADVAAAGVVDGVIGLRLEGFGPSIRARRTIVEAMASAREMAADEADRFWSALRNPLPQAQALWRVSVAPSRAAGYLSALSRASWAMDWAGGLIWLASEDAQTVRRAADVAGGHATLVRAPEEMRRTVPVLHPQPKAIRVLEERVRRAFDPAGVFETGRFLEAGVAD